jgi:hypothetical protein
VATIAAGLMLVVASAASAQDRGSGLPTRDDPAQQAGDQGSESKRPERGPQKDAQKDTRTDQADGDRDDDLEKASDKGRPSGSGDKSAKGREGALVRSLAREEKKYQERMAKIRRLETIAREKGNEQMLARIAEVRTKADLAHQRKLTRLREQHGSAEFDRATQRVKQGMAERANKGKGKGKGRGEKGPNGAKGGASPDGGPDLVTICHVPPDDPEKRITIQVSRDALAAHLAHGDSEGPCPGDEDPAAKRPSGEDRPQGRRGGGQSGGSRGGGRPEGSGDDDDDDATTAESSRKSTGKAGGGKKKGPGKENR